MSGSGGTTHYDKQGRMTKWISPQFEGTQITKRFDPKKDVKDGFTGTAESEETSYKGDIGKPMEEGQFVQAHVVEKKTRDGQVERSTSVSTDDWSIEPDTAGMPLIKHRGVDAMGEDGLFEKIAAMGKDTTRFNNAARRADESARSMQTASIAGTKSPPVNIVDSSSTTNIQGGGGGGAISSSPAVARPPSETSSDGMYGIY